MKGYHAHKNFKASVGMLKMKHTFEYFAVLRKPIELDAHYKLVYHLRKYVKRARASAEKKEKAAALAKKKAAAQ